MDLRELRKAAVQSSQALGVQVPPVQSGTRADKGVGVATIDNYQGG